MKQIFAVEIKRVWFGTVPVLAETEDEARQYLDDNGIDSDYITEDSDNYWREWETTGEVYEGSDNLKDYDCVNYEDDEDDEDDDGNEEG